MAAGFAAAQPPEGYRRHSEFVAEANRVASHPNVTLSPIASTAQGRGVLVLSVGTDTGRSSEPRPAVLVVGSVEGDSLVGSYLALAMAERLAKRASDGELDGVDFYVIPRPSPDACERLFIAPFAASSTNRRPSDDDRDGQTDEDPPEDLNGDGLLTLMRVADEAGDYVPHPNDPRVMVKADPTKGELGAYRLLTEGVDNDGDERWNEDPVGGVAFDRNFPFRYAYFKPGAGPHQVSEPETRAVADFAYDHPNIFAVFCLSSVDSLNHPPKPKSGDGRIKRSVQSGDAKYMAAIAKRYKEFSEANDPLPAADAPGGFAPWAYFHYGRWSLSARGWWPPEPAKEEANAKAETEGKEAAEADGEGGPTPTDDESDSTKDTKAKPKKPDSRAAVELRQLAWLDAAGGDGFVPWTEVEHPDFPGKRVEVGGFKPLAATHPPVENLNAAPLVETLLAVGSMRPRAELASVTGEQLGGGVTRVTAQVVNRGTLPTVSEMGRLAGKHRRLMASLDGPEGMEVLAGPRRQDVGVLQPGESSERRWLVRLPEGVGPSDLLVRVGEPSVGFAEGRPE
ncbi:MAG: M14 family metallopeptidase [Planctomycetota bacterium]